MFTSLKIAGLSGVIAAALVMAFATPEPVASAPSGKVFHDRVGEGGILIAAPAGIRTPASSSNSVRQVVNRSGKADRIEGQLSPGPALVPAKLADTSARVSPLVMTEAPSATALR